MAATAHGQRPQWVEDVDIVDVFWTTPVGTTPGTTDASRRLVEGVVRRTFTRHQQVTDLIQRRGADPNTGAQLRVRGSTVTYGYAAGAVLSLVIDNFSDNTMPTVGAADDLRPPVTGSFLVRGVALPRWPSRELEAAIMNALIDGGADINAPSHLDGRPIRVAIRAGNEGALSVLLARNAAVRWYAAGDDAHVMGLPITIAYQCTAASPAYEQRLLSVYRRLLEHDPTLAVQDGPATLIHSAAQDELGKYSQTFIDSYLDLLVAHGANPMATTNGWTALHDAAFGNRQHPAHVNDLVDDGLVDSSPCVADYVGRHVTAEFVNREIEPGSGDTALSFAAEELNTAIAFSQDDDMDQETRDLATYKMSLHEATIRSLLRCGADISLMPTDTEEKRCDRQVVLPQYTAVLNDVPAAAMAVVNAALRPQRSLAALLTHLLPLVAHNDGEDPAPSPLAFGPHESAAIGWKIAAFCLDMEAANETITRILTVRNSDVGRRVRGAVGHFVKSALRASGKQEVVGGTRYQQQGDMRVKVTVPPLQCFAVCGRGQVVLTGLREVVHRARLEEAARYGIEEGAIAKGFNEHLENADCQFPWHQLGRVDGRGRFVTLDIN